MRLHILAVGRLKPGPERDLCDDYLTRARGLGRKAGISAIAEREFAESQLGTAALRQAAEAKMITDALPARALTILLDERGRDMTSPAFADTLRSRLDEGTADLAFLIGGPDGHDASLRASAALVIGLGRMTWPHRLVRIMLAEQIYRSVTILVNHPYHRA